MLNNAELIKIGQDVVSGKYILKTTCFILAFVTFLVGLFIGFTVSNITTRKQEATIQQSKVDNTNQKQQDIILFKLEEAARQTPEIPLVWVQLGNFYYDNKQPSKAIKAYEKVLAITPNNTDVLVDMGTMYKELGNFNKAIEYFDKAISVDPKHQNAFFNKGIVLYYDLNKKDEAIKVWNKLLRIKPDARVGDNVPLKEFIQTMSK
ncbi:tetratricopeptide repeat protein [Desulfovibrio litoralis]|uniref:Tetratricopeptide repeat-containing protein n=1 Tax=Desulfovibrio litoralis DSM 11393 TaxID=1121455 RepID=A0A1M7T7A4_9BACT|nr:tetratricopeptide repeat protein [Desulfovibrio litoralis]SHN66621.1 Tetratricopeptide repeat-containing protein [Desulfovibrio litoralis DSM 11393]